VQVRYFKTERSIKSVQSRNPGIVSRLKESFILSPIQAEKSKPSVKELASIGITKGIIIIALFAFMKHQRTQYHLSRSAHLQMSQIKKHIYKFFI